MMAKICRVWLLAVAFFIAISAVQSARASEPPADLCSLLPAADLSKSFAQTYDSAQRTVAPRPAPDAVPGTDCTYKPKDATASKVLFRVYVDPSVAAATQLFLRMSKFYNTTTAVSGLGDEAYFDDAHGLHVRKGKARFFINLIPFGAFSPEREKQMKVLAAQVAAQL